MVNTRKNQADEAYQHVEFHPLITRIQRVDNREPEVEREANGQHEEHHQERVLQKLVNHGLSEERYEVVQGHGVRVAVYRKDERPAHQLVYFQFAPEDLLKL